MDQWFYSEDGVLWRQLYTVEAAFMAIYCSYKVSLKLGDNGLVRLDPDSDWWMIQ